MFYIIYWSDGDKKKKSVFTTFEEQQEFLKEKNLLKLDEDYTMEIFNEDCDKKIIINYAMKVLKRMKILKFKKVKNRYLNFESENYKYDLFKINEFWVLCKIIKDEESENSELSISTSLKKLIKQKYE